MTRKREQLDTKGIERKKIRRTSGHFSFTVIDDPRTGAEYAFAGVLKLSSITAVFSRGGA